MCVETPIIQNNDLNIVVQSVVILAVFFTTQWKPQKVKYFSKQICVKILFNLICASCVLRMFFGLLYFRAEASPLHGYQWATVGDITWMMPYENEISFCQGVSKNSEKVLW